MHAMQVMYQYLFALLFFCTFANIFSAVALPECEVSACMIDSAFDAEMRRWYPSDRLGDQEDDVLFYNVLFMNSMGDCVRMIANTDPHNSLVVAMKEVCYTVRSELLSEVEYVLSREKNFLIRVFAGQGTRLWSIVYRDPQDGQSHEHFLDFNVEEKNLVYCTPCCGEGIKQFCPVQSVIRQRRGVYFVYDGKNYCIEPVARFDGVSVELQDLDSSEKNLIGFSCGKIVQEKFEAKEFFKKYLPCLDGYFPPLVECKYQDQSVAINYLRRDFSHEACIVFDHLNKMMVLKFQRGGQCLSSILTNMMSDDAQSAFYHAMSLNTYVTSDSLELWGDNVNFLGHIDNTTTRYIIQGLEVPKHPRVGVLLHSSYEPQIAILGRWKFMMSLDFNVDSRFWRALFYNQILSTRMLVFAVPTQNLWRGKDLMYTWSADGISPKLIMTVERSGLLYSNIQQSIFLRVMHEWCFAVGIKQIKQGEESAVVCNFFAKRKSQHATNTATDIRMNRLTVIYNNRIKGESEVRVVITRVGDEQPLFANRDCVLTEPRLKIVRHALSEDVSVVMQFNDHDRLEFNTCPSAEWLLKDIRDDRVYGSISLPAMF